MGGGEVARYFGKYGSKRRDQAVISAVPAVSAEDKDNRRAWMERCSRASRKPSSQTVRVLHRFFKNFYNTDVLLGKRVSEETSGQAEPRGKRLRDGQPCLCADMA